MRNFNRFTFFFIVLLSSSSGVLASFELTISEDNGLPVVEQGGKRILSSSYVFWGPSWQWAGLKTDFRFEGNGKYALNGTNKKLGFSFVSEIETRNTEITWKNVFDALRESQNVIGGGIVFKLDQSVLKSTGEYPELLPGNRGWSWNGLRFEFTPALTKVYFERGRKSEIRAFFYSGIVPYGEKKFEFRLKVSEGTKIMPTISERFSAVNSSTWNKDRIGWQNFPIDLSYLNEPEKPAGKHGFVRNEDEKLVFEDGNVARFWGTNLSAASLFGTTKVNIKSQAHRLSKMGFNLVRIHHYDSPWVDPNIFGPKPRRNTLILDRDSLDKLDWWIKCLKDEGIYVWLDLHVQRYLKPSDNIYGFDEIAAKTKSRKGADLKGYNYVNLTIKNAMKRFNREYLEHVNRYTEVAYKDEPAIVGLLITNENDVTNHFGNKLLPDKKVPKHNRIYMQEAKVFAKHNNLSQQQTWRSWLHGPSKLFLNDLEARFDREMIDDLRQIGVKVPIATTSTWGKNSLSSLPALSTGNIIDVHSYGGALELEKHPAIASNMTHWMAAGQVAGMPMSVSEWNISRFPVPDRHSSPLLVASKAAHQGWDAMMIYAYAQEPLNDAGKPSNWHAFNDPSLLATLPAAALMYRQRHVREASTTYYLDAGKRMFDEAISPITSAAIRTASEKGKLVIGMPATPSLPWLKPTRSPENSILLKNYRQLLIEQDANSIKSDTGELYRNWKDGLYTIDTPESQAVMGWLGGKSLELSNTRYRIKTVNATIVVQSLDNKSISESKKILVSLGSNSVPYKDLNGRSKLPFYTQPVTGHIWIEAREGLRVYAISNLGTKDELPGNYKEGRYEIDLELARGSHWLILDNS